MLLRQNSPLYSLLAVILATLLALLTILLLAMPLQAQAIDTWRGEYYNNLYLSGTPALVHDDAQVNFVWGWDAPAATVSAE